ncbi:DUF6941 family protein [Mycolicibacter sinensis]|uniref:DUF6941 family protein n=1 Tax=Mycolicibacter sinensis (strain JDM601) TaxID=875328 RepID=UPI00104223E2|nr:hypothetical protein [Mycolicibacter sinensis]
MAELDYAFIAEYAKVEAGKLTAVGASYLSIRPPTLPASHFLSVAGRIRAPEGTESVGLTIRINPPSNLNIVIDGTVNVDADVPRYDGKIAVLFAAATSIPLTAGGLCEVFIDIDGVQERRLAFDVVAPPQ